MNTYNTFNYVLKHMLVAGMSPAEAHFRLAESQYLRMCGSASYTVACVELIVNPALIRRYEAFKQAQTASGEPTQVWKRF